MLLFLLLFLINVSMLIETKCCKWVVRIIFVMTIQNMGEIGDNRKHLWKVFWRMRNLKDRSGVNGRKRRRVTMSQNEPGVLAEQEMPGLPPLSDGTSVRS